MAIRSRNLGNLKGLARGIERAEYRARFALSGVAAGAEMLEFVATREDEFQADAARGRAAKIQLEDESLKHAGDEARAAAQRKVPSRATLTDALIDPLPFAIGRPPYTVRDEKLAGFFLDVGAGRKTFRVQVDAPKRARLPGKVRSTLKLTVGLWPEWTVRKARARAQEMIGGVKSGVDPRERGADLEGPTLQEAWDEYKSRLEKRGRSAKTIEGYAECIERDDLLGKWLKRALAAIGHDRQGLQAEHKRITKKNGPYIANRTMRVLRAVYNNARRTWPGLPDNPVIAIEFNAEEPRKNGMLPEQVAGWFDELMRIENPVRREMHWFTLLSGLRTGDIKRMAWGHVDETERLLHVPEPKGGEKRAFDLPLSAAMIDCLRRVNRLTGDGLVFAPRRGRYHGVGDVRERGKFGEKKETKLSKTGHALRHSFATLADAAGVQMEVIKRLLNHKLTGVTAGYINDAAGAGARFLHDAMETISQSILAQLRPDQRERLDRLTAAELAGGGGAQIEVPSPRLTPDELVGVRALGGRAKRAMKELVPGKAR